MELDVWAIRKLLHEQGETVQGIANKMKISRATLHNWFKDPDKVNLYKIKQLADALGVDVETIMN